MAAITPEAREQMYKALYDAISMRTREERKSGPRTYYVRVPYNGTVQDLFKEVKTSTATITKFLWAVSVRYEIFRITNRGKQGVTIERLKSGISIQDPNTHLLRDITGYELIPFIMEAVTSYVPNSNPKEAPKKEDVKKPVKRILNKRNDVSQLSDEELQSYYRKAEEDERIAYEARQDALYRKNLVRSEMQSREKRRKEEEEARKKAEEEANRLKSHKEFLARLKETARASGISWEELMKLDGTV